MNIGDIYAGKPDANDEIREKGYQEFATNYIEPAGVSIDSLASTEYGTKIFIMGNKGTGKTALLNFLGNYVREQDPSACCSFISFENDFNQVQRYKFDVISQSISTSIKIDDSVASSTSEECDFTYIWKWQFYQKIIDDNTYFQGQLFVDDSYWNRFVSEVGKIEKTIRQGKLVIPARISLTAETNLQIGTVTPGLSVELVDLSKNDFSKSSSYSKFIEIIETAESLLQNISRTDTPYYIFVDELEAYRGHGNVFYRDLRMIRDLLFVVKGLNDIFQSGTKVICSVRPEIITAINRFVMSRQLNKITLGFEERLNWEYTTTNSFDHPIMGVLLRRIQNSEERILGRKIPKKEIIDEWFVKNVFSTNICKYILDRTWYKPRDIIRLLLAAQANRSRAFSKFDQLAFQTFMPEYSKQCLVEIREEMRALYSEKEIDDIFSCMRGYTAVFSFQDIHERAAIMYPQSAFATQTRDVLDDLYRIGVIGNIMMPRSKKRTKRESKWAYKGGDGLIIDDTWSIIVHPALRTALTIKVDSINSTDEPTPKVTLPLPNDITAAGIMSYAEDMTEPFDVSKPQKNTAENEDMTFDELLESSVVTIRCGDSITGVVAVIGSSEITLDLPAKQSGYIDVSEFTGGNTSVDINNLIRIGDEIQAIVTRVNDIDGTVQLSKLRFDTIKRWEYLEYAAQEGSTLEGVVSSRNPGGVVIDLNGTQIIIPEHQTGLSQDVPTSRLIGKTVRFRITKVDRARKRVIGSIRRAATLDRHEKAKRIWSEIEIGKKYSGIVKKMTSYGAFVDIGGVDGMVHVSEISWTRINKPEDVLTLGDKIEVYVISFDPEKKKISLGYRKPEDNPWKKFTNTYQEGDIVSVKIVKLMSFGAFAEIIPGVDGLIHISQIATYHVNSTGDELTIGQIVDTLITSIDYENKKIGLSIRALL